MSKVRKVQLSVLVPPWVKERIVTMAAESGRSQADVATELMLSGLRRADRRGHVPVVGR